MLQKYEPRNGTGSAYIPTFDVLNFNEKYQASRKRVRKKRFLNCRRRRARATCGKSSDFGAARTPQSESETANRRTAPRFRAARISRLRSVGNHRARRASHPAFRLGRRAGEEKYVQETNLPAYFVKPAAISKRGRADGRAAFANYNFSRFGGYRPNFFLRTDAGDGATGEKGQRF